MAPDKPRPGRSTLHFRLSGESVTGKFLSVVTPLPCGPRNCGQSAEALKARAREKRISFFILNSFKNYWLLVPFLGVGGRFAASMAVPVGSHTRSWNCHCLVQSCICSFWQSLMSNVLRPLARLTSS